LYAPSDYKDEKNFLMVNKYNPSTQKEITVLSGESIENTIDAQSVPEKVFIEQQEDTISISNFDKSIKFIELLSNKGYSANIYKPQRGGIKGSLEYSDHETIWLGRKVNPSFATEIIKIAVNFFPHLKYIYISGDKNDVDPPDYVHNQIYVGGATSTAKGYKLKEIPTKEILKLDNSVSRERLHSFIRNYYPN
jgi:hypothetical protein